MNKIDPEIIEAWDRLWNLIIYDFFSSGDNGKDQRIDEFHYTIFTSYFTMAMLSHLPQFNVLQMNGSIIFYYIMDYNM